MHATRARTGITPLDPLDRQGLWGSLVALLEGDLVLHQDIFLDASLGPSDSSVNWRHSSRAEAHHLGEAVEVKVYGRGRIILPTTVRITQDLVCLCGPLEDLLGLRVLVHIGMILLGYLAVGPTDLLVGGRLLDPKDAVVVRHFPSRLSFSLLAREIYSAMRRFTR